MFGILVDGAVIAKYSTPMSVTSNRPVFVSDALNLKRYTESLYSQRWEIETVLEPLSTTHANKLMTEIVTKGHSSPGKAIFPQNVAVRHLRKNTTTLVGAVGTMGTNTLSLPDSELIPAGTFVQLSNHSKIYMVTADYTTGDMQIYPNLVEDVVGDLQCDDAIEFDFYFETTTVRGMVYMDGILMDMGTIKLVEKL